MTNLTLEQTLEEMRKIPLKVLRMAPWSKDHPVAIVKNFEKKGLLYLQKLAEPNYSVMAFREAENDQFTIEFKIPNVNNTDYVFKKIKIGSEEFLETAIADVYISSSDGVFCGYSFANARHTRNSLGIPLLPYGNVIHFIDVNCCGGTVDVLKKNFDIRSADDPFCINFQTELTTKVLEKSEIKLPYSLRQRFHVVPIV